jgi:hypothetical protein
MRDLSSGMLDYEEDVKMPKLTVGTTKKSIAEMTSR